MSNDASVSDFREWCLMMVYCFGRDQPQMVSHIYINRLQLFFTYFGPIEPTKIE